MGIGVFATTEDPRGAGIMADNAAGGFAANFQKSIIVFGDIAANANVNCEKNMSAKGTLSVQGDASVKGTLNVVNDIVLAGPGGDCAEDFDIATSHGVEPGTVMVLEDSGALRPSEQGYDRKVAGVISGAGEYRSGMILGRCESSRQRVPIALVGKVYCKADAQYAPIEVGDLLTTSPTMGHAMKARDSSMAFGAVIGKALRALGEGRGLIPVLVALQ